MKKSELKAIIKECMEELELNEGSYESSEITQAVKKHKSTLDKDQEGEYGYGKMRMQITGDGGASTKWLSITPEQAMKIIKILK